MKDRSSTIMTNINFSMALLILESVSAFVVRTVFIRYMQTEQLGINSLFTDVSTILSVAESGFGATFLSLLYGAIHDDDKKRIYAIYRTMQKVYACIAVFVVVVGAAIFPYVNANLVGSQVDHFLPLYVIFIVNTAATYLCTSAYLLLYAHQKLFIYKRYCFFALFLKVAAQIVAIVYYGSYVRYYFASALFAILPYLLVVIREQKVMRGYPHDQEKLSAEDKHTIIHRVSNGMLLHIGYIIFNGTDYILISRFLGLKVAGIYSNYMMFVKLVTAVIATLFTSVTATIGDMLCDGNKERVWANYKKVCFANVVMIIGSMMCFCALFQPVIFLWVGKAYLLSDMEMLLIVLVFAMGEEGLFRFASSISLSTGVFAKESKYRFAAGLLNVGLSILLAQSLGLKGILLGTILSAALYHLPGVVIVEKYVVTYPLPEFLAFFGKTVAKCAIAALFGYAGFIGIAHLIGLKIWGLVVSSVGMVFVFGVMFVILFFKSDEFVYYVNFVKRYIVEFGINI